MDFGDHYYGDDDDEIDDNAINNMPEVGVFFCRIIADGVLYGWLKFHFVVFHINARLGGATLP